MKRNTGNFEFSKKSKTAKNCKLLFNKKKKTKFSVLGVQKINFK